MPNDNNRYQTFLNNLKVMVQIRIDEAQMGEDAQNFSDRVFRPLEEEGAAELLNQAAAEQQVSVRNALEAELDFFNNRYSRETSPTAFQAAHTVKTSLHNVLGNNLPGWLKKMLTILNELLSLISPP